MGIVVLVVLVASSIEWLRADSDDRPVRAAAELERFTVLSADNLDTGDKDAEKFFGRITAVPIAEGDIVKAANLVPDVLLEEHDREDLALVPLRRGKIGAAAVGDVVWLVGVDDSGTERFPRPAMYVESIDDAPIVIVADEMLDLVLEYEAPGRSITFVKIPAPTPSPSPTPPPTASP